MPPSCSTEAARWICRGCGCRGSTGWIGARLDTRPMLCSRGQQSKNSAKNTDQEVLREARGGGSTEGKPASVRGPPEAAAPQSSSRRLPFRFPISLPPVVGRNPPPVPFGSFSFQEAHHRMRFLTCSATDLPLAPTFAHVGCRAPHIDERKLGRRPPPRNRPTVRDRWGNGSAPSCEGGDRRFDSAHDGSTAGGGRKLPHPPSWPIRGVSQDKG